MSSDGPAPRRVAVVGAGWAGLAAAVHATLRGGQVTLFDMAPQAGGRARSVDVSGRHLDNGQHILIGAYSDTLALMRAVGADPDRLFERRPLTLRYPDGGGLQARGGPPALAFARAVLGLRAWSWAERLGVLRETARWRLAGFQAPAGTTVATLIARVPANPRREVFEPLCVAALNTPAEDADAQVFLRVLRDALFAGPGSADLLLPRAGLSELLPSPALRWLGARGAALRIGQRVQALQSSRMGWQVNGERYDGVILACGPRESARLVADAAPAWAATCAALPYEPIVTVTLQAPGAGAWPCPMLALRCGPDAPAQFAFDLGALGLHAGLYSFVISGAAAWVAAGGAATARSVQAQARKALSALGWPEGASLAHLAMEKRATFRCVPGLQRPPAAVAPGLWAAGDHVAGPYPATLEGAVRAGRHAAEQAVVR